MPPVRWKLYVTVIILSTLWLSIYTDAQHMQVSIEQLTSLSQDLTHGNQEPISMTADGWRPIIGTRRENFLNTNQKDVVSTTSQPPSISKPPANKIDTSKQYFQPPHAPHIPIGAVTVTRPESIKKYPSIKPHLRVNPNGKRNTKPLRVATSPYNPRDELLKPANTGAFTFYMQGSNLKNRGFVTVPNVNTHFTVNQPQSHVEFSNRFAVPQQEIFQPFVNPYVIRKPPQTNEVHYQFPMQDDLTRNLVPPPFYKQNPVSEKPKLQVAPPPPKTDVQVTKEKIKVYHNEVPVNFDYSRVTEGPRPQTYEVTEDKWPEPPPPPGPQIYRPAFLPTPYKPEVLVVPTLATQQADVSTIYSQIAQQYQKEKYEYNTINPSSFFDIKEVSTHYPIVGRPNFVSEEPEIINEITTEEPTTTSTRIPTRVRGNYRRRRPTSTTSTTTSTTTTTEAPIQEIESYELNRSPEVVTEVETERPRRRRPIRYRTSTERAEYEAPVRYHTSSEGSDNEPQVRVRGKIRNRHRKRPEVTESSLETIDYIQTTSYPQTTKIIEEYTVPNRYRLEEPTELSVVQEQTHPTEVVQTTSLRLPEETTTVSYQELEDDVSLSETIEEIEEETTLKPTTTTSTTSTTTPTTPITRSNRIRGRPIKYDNSNRPRFSVKDYRQKLNQYTSTTTENYRSTSDTLRVRPNRIRRPSTTTTSTPLEDEDEEEPTTFRSRFVPKDPRHGAKDELGQESIITEKNVKSVNTRLRPFGRYRSTTSATTTTTTTPKVTIKSNLFGRRRPPSLSLKNRIQNRYNKTQIQEKEEEKPKEDETKEETEFSEQIESTLPYVEDKDDLEKNFGNKNVKVIEITTENDEQTTNDLLKNDAFMLSQRISELTSSAKNDYETPGMFKNVPTASRRIPSYFTISTDDPILPIEAFFPNIKDKERD